MTLKYTNKFMHMPEQWAHRTHIYEKLSYFDGGGCRPLTYLQQFIFCFHIHNKTYSKHYVGSNCRRVHFRSKSLFWYTLTQLIRFIKMIYEITFIISASINVRCLLLPIIPSSEWILKQTFQAIYPCGRYHFALKYP